MTTGGTAPARHQDDAVTPEQRSSDDDRQPVITINDQGLTLGLDANRAWIIWNRTNTTWPAQDRLLWLLPLLEQPPDEVEATIASTGQSHSCQRCCGSRSNR
jgi:hypothetical protein